MIAVLVLVLVRRQLWERSEIEGGGAGPDEEYLNLTGRCGGRNHGEQNYYLGVCESSAQLFDFEPWRGMDAPPWPVVFHQVGYYRQVHMHLQR